MMSPLPIAIFLLLEHFVLKGKSDFLFTTCLLEFKNPDNRLLSGQRCDEDNLFGVQCDINLKICVEDMKNSDADITICDNEFKETGVIEGYSDSDDVIYKCPAPFNGYYTDWPNPDHFAGEGEYKGIRLKIQAWDSGLGDDQSRLIDQFSIEFYPPPGTNDLILEQAHSRPNLESTSIKIKISVQCLSHDHININPLTCVPDTPTEPSTSPWSTQSTTRLPCQHGGTRNATECICPPLFSGKYCQIAPTRNCYDLFQYYGSDVGIFEIKVNGQIVQVYCDHGWTVIQRRTNDGFPFNQTWNEYKRGFGYPEHDKSFWLGNELIYHMTNDPTLPMKLEIDLWDCEGSMAQENYPSFKTMENGQPFLVWNGQANNHLSPQDCANIFAGGWWYGLCGSATLNGQYYDHCSYSQPTPTTSPVSVFGNGILWLTWKNDAFYSLYRTEMKIKPN